MQQLKQLLAMEAEIIPKNGKSPKNYASRENHVIRMLALTLAIIDFRVMAFAQESPSFTREKMVAIEFWWLFQTNFLSLEGTSNNEKPTPQKNILNGGYVFVETFLCKLNLSCATGYSNIKLLTGDEIKHPGNVVELGMFLGKYPFIIIGKNAGLLPLAGISNKIFPPMENIDNPGGFNITKSLFIRTYLLYNLRLLSNFENNFKKTMDKYSLSVGHGQEARIALAGILITCNYTNKQYNCII